MFSNEPIDWSYYSLPVDMRPRYIGCLIVLSVLLIFWAVCVSMCDMYLRRRKKKIYRYYKVDVTYKNGEEPDTLYIKTFGKIDICMFFRTFADTKIERIKNIDEIDEEIIDLSDLIAEVNEGEKNDRRSF